MRSQLSNFVRIVVISAILIALATSVHSGSESLRPDGDPSPNFMSIQNSTRHGATSDDNDATYIYSSSPGAEKLSLSNNTSIPADATIDSVVIEYRARKDFGPGTATLKARVFRGAGWYCDSEEWDPSASWTNHRFNKFTKAPSAAATCNATWTKSLIDSLDIQIYVVAGGDEPKVAEVWAHVYWTEAGETTISMRRRKLLLSTN